MSMFEGGAPGTNWIRRIRRIIDLVDTPSQYGTVGQGLVLDTTERKLAWLTLAEVFASLDHIILYADPAVVYEADDTGMAAAIAAASAGDTIWSPPAVYTNDYTIPAGVTIHGESRAGVVFSGEITLSDGSKLESLSVVRSKNSSDIVYGVIAPSSGVAYINNCTISVTQIGSGHGIGIFTFELGSLGVDGRDPGLVDCYVYGSKQDIV